MTNHCTDGSLACEDGVIGKYGKHRPGTVLLSDIDRRQPIIVPNVQTLLVTTTTCYTENDGMHKTKH